MIKTQLVKMDVMEIVNFSVGMVYLMPLSSVRMVIGFLLMDVMKIVNSNVGMVYKKEMSNVMTETLMMMMDVTHFVNLPVEMAYYRRDSNVMMVAVKMVMDAVNFVQISNVEIVYWILDKVVMMEMILQAMGVLIHAKLSLDILVQ